jgi:hypothetical protein
LRVASVRFIHGTLASVSADQSGRHRRPDDCKRAGIVWRLQGWIVLKVMVLSLQCVGAVRMAGLHGVLLSADNG